MRRLIQCLAIYVLIQSGSNEFVKSYDGMSMDAVQRLLNEDGKKATFITQSEYESFISSHQPIINSPNAIKDQAKIDLNTKSKTDAQRIDAIIKYLDLDK
jgi:beta-lactam-binding protein with PASTA domain